MSEIPRVAVHHDDDRLRSMRLRIAEQIERRRRARRALPGKDARLRRVDIDAAREVLAMAEQHERAQRRVVLVSVEGLRQPHPRRRIDPVLDERTVEADEHDVAAALHRDRHRRAKRHVGERRDGFGRRRLRLRAGRHHAAVMAAPVRRARRPTFGDSSCMTVLNSHAESTRRAGESSRREVIGSGAPTVPGLRLRNGRSRTPVNPRAVRS